MTLNIDALAEAYWADFDPAFRDDGEEEEEDDEDDYGE